MPSGIDVTAALRADPHFIEERMPADLMNLYLASFNDMTYDYNAAYNKYAALNSPLSGCANPNAWDAMVDVDCVTTEFGALNSNGVFTVGAWSDCFGLCNGDNWNAAGEGLKMQYRKIVTSPRKAGKTCGKLYNIQSCTGNCPESEPNIEDHYSEWKSWPTKYACKSGLCAEDVMGTYATLDECTASGCASPPLKYECDSTTGTCTGGLSGVDSEADCNAAC